MEQFERNELSESTIDIKEYFYLFWSWAWLIALAGVLAAAIAYVVSMQITPIYESTTTLIVSAPSAINGGVDPTALVTSQTMTSTYAEMLQDQSMLQGVIDQFKLPTTPKDFKKSVTVNVVTNTQLLTIAVQDANPGRAADMANFMASTFTARIRELQSQRYSASREGLSAQVTDMEQQIAATTVQIATIQQQMNADATQTAQVVAKTTPPAPPAPAPTDSAAMIQLQARLTQYRTIYADLVTSYEQVRLSEEQTSSNVAISEPATAASIPVKPKTLLNTLLAFVAGMLLAAGGVFTADTLDDTIKNPEELRRKFNVPILGMIAKHESPKGKPIALAEPRSPTAEAFRALRTNIIFSGVAKPLRRIMVTSPTPQDGKTTVTSNLAVVLAQGEKKTLLIDADLRRPSVQTQFGLTNRLGLTDLFVRPLDALSSVLQSVNVPRLAVITSGSIPPNPAELLTSLKMSQILDQLGQKCDVILLDTPPVLTVTDAVALAPSMDGVILIARPGVTKLGAFQQALEQLRAVNARVLGVVMNEVDPSSRKYGYYYNRYYSKYSHYYEKGNWGKKGADRDAKETEANPEVTHTLTPS